jgi:hypothetical protein
MTCTRKLIGSYFKIISGPASLKWFKEDELLVERTAVDTNPVTSAVDPRVTVRPDNTLQIQNLQGSDDGEYTCQVARLAPLKSIQKKNAVVVLCILYIRVYIAATFYKLVCYRSSVSAHRTI